MHLVAETPEVVHNAYLQLLVENGVIGLVLFLTIVFLALRCAWRAIGRFGLIGDESMANLARAVMIAIIAMLAANFFISDVNDFRLWILFALGPVMLTIAKSPVPPDERVPPVQRRRLLGRR